MPAQALFGISVAFGFIAWGIVAALYFWLLLRAQARVDALHPLLLLHSFRFVGLAFLVKGVVAPELPAAFAVPAAPDTRMLASGSSWRSWRSLRGRGQPVQCHEMARPGLDPHRRDPGPGSLRRRERRREA
jgi:hypothetical protein